MQRIGGARRKTRNKYRKESRQRGKMSLTSYFKEYELGDKVLLKAEPAYQKGVYFRRFHGKSGIVSRKRGFCYEISIKDHDKNKTVIVHPVHMRKA